MIGYESEGIEITFVGDWQVLCLQLKRFTYVTHGAHTRHEKLTRAVNFPLRGACVYGVVDVSIVCVFFSGV